MSECTKSSDTPSENKVGELYKLTFPNGYDFNDCYKCLTQDIESQTEESDIIQITELTEAFAKLTTENANLCREQNLIRSSLQSDFHRRLADASNELYCRVNQKLAEIERFQRDRVEVVRRAFKSQLSDALSHMRSLYNEKLRKKSLDDRTFMESEESIKYTRKIADLTAKLKKSEIRIKELTMQISEYQEFDSQPTMIMETESEISENPPVEIEEEEDDNTEFMEEKNKLKSIINDLTQKIEELEKENSSFEKTVEKLNTTVQSVKDELISTSNIVEGLKSEKHSLEEKFQNLFQENQTYQLEINTLKSAEPPKLPTPRKEVKIEKPSTKSTDIQKNFKEFPDLSKEVMKLKEEITKLQNNELERENEVNQIKNNFLSENRKYLQEIKIIQSINIKLKEEMFKRNELQNNFKTLHSASVSYARNNQPMGILPNQSITESKINTINIVENIPNFNSKSQFTENDKTLLKNFIEIK